MRAKLVREFTSPERPLATSQGNMKLLPNSNVFIGWGSQSFLSEFSYDGELLLNGRFPWSGHPTENPAVALEQLSDEKKVKLYASWNGATDVESWELLAGTDAGRLESVGSIPRDGFETWSGSGHKRTRQALNPSSAGYLRREGALL
jgi:hypothetical protein